MKIENCKLKIPSRAFSLVEATAFLVVLLIGFMVFFRLVNSYIFTLKTAKERVIANFLAQEGLELVVAKRNQNFNNDQAWLKDLFIGSDFWINPDLTTTGVNSKLFLNNNIYTHTSGATTIFSRTVKIAKTGGNSAAVTSTVNWGKSSLKLTTTITKWHPRSPAQDQ